MEIDDKTLDVLKRNAYNTCKKDFKNEPSGISACKVGVSNMSIELREHALKVLK